MVRNGHARQRQVTTAAGVVTVRAPRVDDRRTDPVTGERIGFRSMILPPWCRKSPKVAEVLPLLYLHGLSTGDFAPALEAFFGSAAGLSAAAIGRLLGAWQADYQAFCQRDLAERDYVYLGLTGSTSGSAWSSDHAERAIEVFARDYGVKWPKAVAKVTDDAEALLCFLDFPAEHCVHLKTSNPIWVFSFPHQFALPEREMAGRWWQGPDSESDCCCSMDAFELEVSGAVTEREAIDGLA